MQRPFLFLHTSANRSRLGGVVSGMRVETPPLSRVDFGTSFAEWFGWAAGCNGVGKLIEGRER